MYDIIIIGAGPSGLMCANETKNKKVLIIEKNNTPGKKLLITGGGRCNVTNLKNNNRFLEEINYNRKHLYSTINNFGPRKIWDYFITKNVKLKQEEDNKVFPVSNKSQDILNALMMDLDQNNFKFNEEVKNIETKDNIKIVSTNKGTYNAKNIVIATGGKSFSYTGSTGDNMKFAKMLNQPTIDLFPAETGIVLEEKTYLEGTSISNVTVKFNKYKINGNLMFTHNGLSGSSIMVASEHIYLNKIKEIFINFLPNTNNDDLINEIYNFDKNKEISTFFNSYLPKKLVNYILKDYKDKKIKSINYKEIVNIVNKFNNYKFNIDKVNEIEKAYVTGGGIDMKYINSKTMESTINKGVYFIGESLDIHGKIGGYNITLALSTGYTAGINLQK